MRSENMGINGKALVSPRASPTGREPSAITKHKLDISELLSRCGSPKVRGVSVGSTKRDLTVKALPYLKRCLHQHYSMVSPMGLNTLKHIGLRSVPQVDECNRAEDEPYCNSQKYKRIQTVQKSLGERSELVVMHKADFRGSEQTKRGSDDGARSENMVDIVSP